MKEIKFYLFGMLSIIGTCNIGCKKNTNIESNPLVAINIVHAITGENVNGIKINANKDIVNRNSISIQAITPNSDGIIRVYDAVNGKEYFNQSQITKSGELYSLYLTGTSTSPEGILIKDIIKPFRVDNVVASVRVVNLCANAGPISVTLASSPSSNVFTNIGYKEVTEFRDIPFALNIPTGTNVFQFRDAVNPTVVRGSFTLPTTARNKSYTIVLRGLVGGSGTNAIGTLGQPHF